MEKGKGSFVICATKALEVTKALFESKVAEHDGITYKNIYQTVFDDIDDSLEDFRVKIYYSSKEENIKRRPVQGKIIHFENED